MFNPQDIDTNGFPYVNGVEPRIYFSINVPETERDCNDMIKEVHHTIEDICLQLKISKIDEATDSDWEKSALHKLRILSSQKRLLIAQRDLFIKNRDALHEKNNDGRLRNLEVKLEGTIKKLSELKTHVHNLTVENDCYKTVLTRLLLEIDNGTVEKLSDVNREYIDFYKSFSDNLPEDYGKIGKWENGRYIKKDFKGNS